MRNRIQCLQCGAVLESRHRHDYVRCSCPNQTMTDGGNDYWRRAAVDFSLVKEIGDDDSLILPIESLTEA